MNNVTVITTVESSSSMTASDLMTASNEITPASNELKLRRPAEFWHVNDEQYLLEAATKIKVFNHRIVIQGKTWFQNALIAEYIYRRGLGEALMGAEPRTIRLRSVLEIKSKLQTERKDPSEKLRLDFSCAQSAVRNYRSLDEMFGIDEDGYFLPFFSRS